MDSSDPFRPSFFEVYAASHLSSALRPALRYVLEILSVRQPALVSFAARSDDIFTALLLVFETSQLHKESALLAESFYSLRRATSVSLKEPTASRSSLSAQQIITSIVFSVVAPHVKTLLDNWYSNATGGAAAELFTEGLPPGMMISSSEGTNFDNESQSSLTEVRSRASHLPRLLVKVLTEMKQVLRALWRIMTGPTNRRLALKWYPRLSALLEGVDLLFNLLYLFGRTKYFSLSLAAQGLVLRRASTAELLRSASRSTSFFPPGERHVDLARVVSAASERLLSVFKTSFFAGIFLFRFLQYYYAAEVRQSLWCNLAVSSLLQIACFVSF